jgi:hypothetical protein
MATAPGPDAAALPGEGMQEMSAQRGLSDVAHQKVAQVALPGVRHTHNNLKISRAAGP